MRSVKKRKLFQKLIEVNEQERMHAHTNFFLKLRKYLLKITNHVIVYGLYFTFIPSY